MRVFISGPVTGMPDGNVAAFATAAYRLRRAGHEVYSPVESVPPKLSHEQAMLMCLQELTRDSGTVPVYMGKPILEPRYKVMVQLDGWQHCFGAKVEARVADACGIKRTTLDEFFERPSLFSEDK